MCAARNSNLRSLPAQLQEAGTLPASANDTGLTYASRLQAEVLRAARGEPAPRFEFELVENRRTYPRLPLQFPVRLRKVGERDAGIAESLVTLNISSTGVCFLAPLRIEPKTPVELEIGLTDRPRGRERVRMHTTAHVVRVDSALRPGWHALAVTFDEITFERDGVSGRA